MPTYEYTCSSCRHEWEFEQSIKESPLTECPACHAQTARRQISRGTGFILKGGGWYSDLYSSASNKPAAAATSSESKPSADKADKSESSGSSTSSDSPTKSSASGPSVAAA